MNYLYVNQKDKKMNDSFSEIEVAKLIDADIDTMIGSVRESITLLTEAIGQLSVDESKELDEVETLNIAALEGQAKQLEQLTKQATKACSGMIENDEYFKFVQEMITVVRQDLAEIYRNTIAKNVKLCKNLDISDVVKEKQLQLLLKSAQFDESIWQMKKEYNALHMIEKTDNKEKDDTEIFVLD